MRTPWRRGPRGRVFEVECECGEQFRVGFDPEAAEPPPGDPFLVRLSGRCPWCGLRLEDIDPFGGSRRTDGASG